MLTLGILGSGSGSNMQAILDAIQSGSLKAKIGLVLSDNPDAFILERAKQNDIPCGIIDCANFRNKFPLDAQKETADRLLAAGVDLVCLAGFMRLVKAPLLDAFPSKIINIHPSLLPAFPGVAAWEQAISARAAESGVTVHMVDSGMDTGPIIHQKSLKIEAGEDAKSLHQRLQLIEHRIYPQAIVKHAKKLGL